MTTLMPLSASSPGPKTATDQTNLLTVATIASKVAYTATTNDQNCMGWETATFAVAYTKGDETSVRFRAEGWDGVVWQPLGYKGVQASSYSPINQDLMECAASFTGTLPPCDCRGLQKVRLTLIANGGTPTGTVGVTVTLGKRSPD